MTHKQPLIHSKATAVQAKLAYHSASQTAKNSTSREFVAGRSNSQANLPDVESRQHVLPTSKSSSRLAIFAHNKGSGQLKTGKTHLRRMNQTPLSYSGTPLVQQNRSHYAHQLHTPTNQSSIHGHKVSCKALQAQGSTHSLQQNPA